MIVHPLGERKHSRFPQSYSHRKTSDFCTRNKYTMYENHIFFTHLLYKQGDRCSQYTTKTITAPLYGLCKSTVAPKTDKDACTILPDERIALSRLVHHISVHYLMENLCHNH